ncbi:MAG: glycosyltransferase [bacterium]|nr:glycosyltransferase [bacterium]
MKIALIHDYIISYGGAEKTFKVLSEIFPDAELYTLFYDKSIVEKLKIGEGRKIHTSFLQKFPRFLRRKYQLLLPLMPIAAETLDFREFDIVISSSFSFTKGIITRPKTTHISYCHTPTRYLWDKSRKRFILHYFRVWDRQASERVDEFIASSKTVQDRIRKYYKRESVVIYPPVEMGNRLGVTKLVSSKGYVERLTPNDTGVVADKRKTGGEFYLIVSQLRKYKRIDLAIDAFNKLGLELVIIGDGPEKRHLKKIAKKNIKILGWQPEEITAKYYKNCTAFIFPGEDDFGIAPVEAMSYGKPVLAYRKGGATETIIEGKTGEFFDYENSAILADCVRRFRMNNVDRYNAKLISEHAKKFSKERFKKEILEFVDKVAKSKQI